MEKRENKVAPVGEKTQVELYLEQLSCAKEEITDLQWRLQKTAARAYGLASPSGFSNTRVQSSSGPNASFVRRLERRDDLSLCLSARIRLLQALISQAVGLIDRYTSGRESKILILRYLEGYEWLQISKEVDNLCPKQLRRIARKGMAKIILPEGAIWINHNGIAA